MHSPSLNVGRHLYARTRTPQTSDEGEASDQICGTWPARGRKGAAILSSRTLARSESPTILIARYTSLPGRENEFGLLKLTQATYHF